MSTVKPHISATGHILVVDDHEANRRLLNDFLRRFGYQVSLAVDGHDGVQKASYGSPDLVLMDIHMPVCDGIAACRLLKADPRTAEIPLIFLTAAAQPEDRVRGLSEGAVDYIVKPFDFDEVRLRVGIHLRARRTAEPEADADDGNHSPDARLFRAARQLMLQDLAKTTELETLARAVGSNKRRLGEAFRTQAGTTVFDYLREMRLREAHRQLAETTLDIQTIAQDVGYSSGANFSTAFRERFGLSPRQFRQVASKAKA
ncbi:MAG: response regulator [Arenimonas sp.]